MVALKKTLGAVQYRVGVKHEKSIKGAVLASSGPRGPP